MTRPAFRHVPSSAAATLPPSPLASGRMCVTCIMDQSDPGITFDETGVCNHCRRYRVLLADLADRRRPGALERVITRIRTSASRKPYDCVVGLSGGTDSSYLVLMAKRLGLRPLAVHLDNGWNEELAVANIEKIVTALDLDLVTVVLQWQEFRDLQLAFLKASTPDAEIPTDHAILASLQQVAAHHGLRHILTGHNVATEGGGVPAWSQGHSDWRYINQVHRLFGAKPLRSFPHLGPRELVWYRLVKRIRFVSLLDYLDYDKTSAQETLQRELGWVPYAGKHGESRYTKFYQDWILPQKFGFDKRRLHLSGLIWSGQLERAAALEAMASPPYENAHALEEDREYVRKKLEISPGEFDAIMSATPKTFWDYPSYKRTLRRYPRLLALYHGLKRE